MHKNLRVAIFLVILATALIAGFYQFCAKREVLDVKDLPDNVKAEAIEPLPGPGRDAMSVDDAKLAIARKLLPPGTKSLLKVPLRLRHGDHVWNEDGVPAGRVAIWVDLRRQMISAFRNGHEIGTAVIVYGAKDMASPEGVFPILRKVQDYHSRTYDAAMPNSLFITNDGVALHGSPMSSRRASHGCIGLPVDFARKLFEASNVGDLVQITRSDPIAAR